jgi:hypothetical protein
MKKYLIILFFSVTNSLWGQEVNFEMKAVEFYIHNIESDTVFRQACNCASVEYDTTMNLTIYDSSFLEINSQMALNKFNFKWQDSLIWTELKTQPILIKRESKNHRIKITKDPESFSSTSYLIRFAERLKYKEWTIIEFNIKSAEKCSGLNYYLLFNEQGEIEQFQTIIWCDCG